MKHPTQILKRTTSNKRSNNKKRRFRPQVTYNETSKINSVFNISKNIVLKETEDTTKVFSTTKKPHPMIPRSFPVFENITIDNLTSYNQKQPKEINELKTKEEEKKTQAKVMPPYKKETLNTKQNKT